MSRKILFLSASALCLSLLSGSGFAASPSAINQSSAIISAPLAPPASAGQIILAKAEGSYSITDSAKNAGMRAGRDIAEKKLRKATGRASSALPAAPSAKNMKMPKISGKEAAGKLPKAAKQESGLVGAMKNKGSKARAAAEKAESKISNPGRRAKKSARAAEGGEKAADRAPVRRGTTAETYQRQYREDNCVCVEGYYCIGPRGGHYCYTSGGNKRYLKRE